MTFGQLGDLIVLTLRDPALAVRTLRGFDLGGADRWWLLLLAASLSSLLAGLGQMMLPGPVDGPMASVFGSPLRLALLQLAAMVVSAAAVTTFGRAFGGTGRFPDALLLVSWIELILVGFQAVQLVLMVVLPPSASVMSLMAFAVSIYLTIALTKELHGFTSTPKVALGFIGGIFLLATVLSMIAAAFGILPEVAP